MSNRKRVTVKAKRIPRSSRWRAKLHKWATSMWSDLRGKTKNRAKTGGGGRQLDWPVCSLCERKAPPWVFDKCTEHPETCGCCCELGRGGKVDRPGRISRAEAAKRLAAQGRPAKEVHHHHDHWYERDTERADDQQEPDQGAEQGQEAAEQATDQPQDSQAADSGEAVGGGEQ